MVRDLRILLIRAIFEQQASGRRNINLLGQHVVLLHRQGIPVVATLEKLSTAMLHKIAQKHCADVV